MAKIIRNEDLTPEKLRTFSADSIEHIYNALDVCVTHEIFQKQIQEVDDTTAATYSFELALANPILEMNVRGVLCDLDAKESALQEFYAKRQLLEHHLNRILFEGVGMQPPFNWRSHAQVKQLLYGVLGLKPVKARNSNGQWVPTANRDALEKLSSYFSAKPLCTHILALRDLEKKIQFLETDMDEDGRFRTSYNIAGTNTGRLSSAASDYGTGGNNQNIERALRKIFIPDEGMKFGSIDLEQADSRHIGAILWDLFVDKVGPELAGAYLDACESGDLHTTVAMMVWSELDWPNDPAGRRTLADEIFYRWFTRRDATKRLGHGTNFYGTPRTMATHTKIEEALVKSFQHRYFTAFPLIGDADRRTDKDNWHNWVRRQIADFGCITTPFYSRRRYFFGREDDDRTLREAIAYAPQSMTADAIDTGIIRLWESELPVQVLIQVHDSVLFQYPEDQEAEIIPAALDLLTIRHQLKHGREFFVPCEAKIGYNWADHGDDNPAGLIKWRGPNKDLRARPAFRTAQSPRDIFALINGA